MPQSSESLLIVSHAIDDHQVDVPTSTRATQGGAIVAVRRKARIERHSFSLKSPAFPTTRLLIARFGTMDVRRILTRPVAPGRQAGTGWVGDRSTACSCFVRSVSSTARLAFVAFASYFGFKLRLDVKLVAHCCPAKCCQAASHAEAVEPGHAPPGHSVYADSTGTSSKPPSAAAASPPVRLSQCVPSPANRFKANPFGRFQGTSNVIC
jgi:hypothetical protein